MMTRKLFIMTLLACLMLGLVSGVALGVAPVEASAADRGVAVSPRDYGAPPALPGLQTETPAAETSTIPDEGVEDTLPWWLLALPLVFLVVAGLLVWRRPAMEKPQTADPIAPQTTGASIAPMTDRTVDTDESARFEERD
jgi:hypothetical protein